MSKWTYLQHKNRVTEKINLWLLGGERAGGGINWEVGIDIYTQLHIKEMTNKDLL